MSEEKTRTKKFIQDGVIRYARVTLTTEDELEEKNLEIKRLKNLIDELRSRIENLEQEQQRQELVNEEVGPISQYDCYS